MRSLHHAATALALAALLVGCAGSSDPAADTSEDRVTGTAADDDSGTASDDTSMPADDGTGHDGTVTEAEAEAVGTAYLGLTEEEATDQAEVDGRPFRVGARDGEQYALTEDYVIGRVTATIEDGVITQVTVESDDGPVTVVS